MPSKRPLTQAVLVVAVSAALAGCGGGEGDAKPAAASPPTALDSASGSVPAPSSTPTTSGSTSPSASPSPAKPQFNAEIKKVSRSTLKYSWRKGCPVAPSGLRLIEMTYWGMDKRTHTGKLVVNAKVADDVTKVFKRLYDKRYPIRRMELVDVYKGSDWQSIEADNTSAFNCRNATGGSSWSQHAYGLAIDINPCENPYVSSSGHVDHKDCVKFKNRSRRDPGVIHKGDVVVRAFDSIGWGWGGTWSGVKDYQHFSSTGR